jgi:MFS family permease
MNAPSSVTPRPVLALVTTLGVQAVTTLAMNAPAVMAPAVAPLLDLPPQRIGWFVGIAYFMAMFSGLAIGEHLVRLGAVRVSRWALIACAIGLCFAALASVPGFVLALVPAALALGVAYGLPNPAASIVLARHAPADRRGLFFSIKQTGVPVGIGLAGLLVPALLGLTSWPVTLLVLAAASAIAAVATRFTEALDLPPAERPARVSRPAGPLALVRGLIGPLGQVWRLPAVRRLGVASLAFAMTQLCFTTFLVSYLKLELGMSLAAAAGVLAAAQLVSVACRVLWGQVADRWITPLRLLALLGLTMGGSALLLGLLQPGTPVGVALAVSMACAATTMAWNGVYFAELTRRAPPEALGALTGGTQFLTFFGGMSGPVIFASLVGPLGGHGPTYALMALAPAAIGAWLWIAATRED